MSEAPSSRPASATGVWFEDEFGPGEGLPLSGWSLSKAGTRENIVRCGHNWDLGFDDAAVESAQKSANEEAFADSDEDEVDTRSKCPSCSGFHGDPVRRCRELIKQDEEAFICENPGMQCYKYMKRDHVLKLLESM